MASSAAAIVDRLKTSLKPPNDGKIQGGDFSKALESFLRTESKDTRIGVLTKYFNIVDLLPSDSYPGEYHGALLLLELIEEALSFALDRGFRFYEVHIFLYLYVCSLDLICNSTQESDGSKAQQDVVEKFKEVVGAYFNAIPQTKLLIMSQFVKDSVFQHYNLYHYLLTEMQPVDHTKLRLDIEVAESPPPLADGIEETEFKRKEKLRELETEQARRKGDFVATCDLAQQEADSLLKEAYQTALDKVNSGVTLTQTEVSEIVDVLAKAHMDSVKLAISQDLQMHDLDMQLKVEKVEMLSPKRELQSPQMQTSSPTKSKTPTKGNKTPTGRKSKLS